jgi:putative ABC transport system permease protein
MIGHYCAASLRHFRRHKLTTAVNVIALAIGLMCFFTVYGLATYLQSTDVRVPNTERVVAITQKVTIPGAASQIPDAPMTALAAGRFMQTDYPELELVAREGMPREVPLTAGSTRIRVQGRFVDPTWFEMFPLPFVAGSRDRAARMVGGIVLSESTAIALFGDSARAIGRSVLIFGSREVEVVGVLGQVPQPARISTDPGASALTRVDLLLSMDILENSPAGKFAATVWNSPFTSTFVRLPADGSLTLEQLRERLTTFDDRHVPPGEWQCDFGAVPLSHYMTRYFDAITGAGRMGVSSVTLLYALGALVLLVSCINYANLASAQATTRAKEVGMRRVVGARRGQVILQHLCEAGTMALAAFIVAGVVLELAALLVSSPVVTFVIGTALASPRVWLAGGALLFAVTLIAGAYPAFVLSRVQALQALRTGRATSRGRMATILVGGQFAASSVLLVCILVMSAQHDSMRKAAFAATDDPVVAISAEFPNIDLLRTELLRQPHVKSVSASYVQLWGAGGAIASVSTSADASASRRMVSQERVQYDFFGTVGFRFLAGRDFDRARGSDATAVVIDRMLAEQNGWTPASAVGKTLYQWKPGDENTPAIAYTVIGVVENKTTRLLGLGATSNVFFLVPAMAATPLVRIDRSNVAAALSEIDGVWNRLQPRIAIKRRFADELLGEALATFEVVNRVLGGVAMLALVIAVLGLIGMSVHSIGRRTHEIGVRKTLGASVRGIVALLLRDFSKPVIVANLIAWPLAFVAMQGYLSIFTQRVGLTWVPFALSLAFTIGIAWLAVSAQAIHAARLKPARVLRYE